MELCGRDSTKFIAQVLLGPLLLCNFSRSHSSYLGTWLHSALRNTSLSTVTLIPPFLFSHVKNKWGGKKVQLLLAEHSACAGATCHRGLHPHSAPVWGSLQALVSTFRTSILNFRDCHPSVLGQETGPLAPSASSKEREGDDSSVCFTALGMLLPLEEPFPKVQGIYCISSSELFITSNPCFPQCL